MKFCKDCEHLWLTDWCQHPKLGVNTVTGGPQSARASEIRGTQGRCADDWTRCGPEAARFEPNLRRRFVTWLKQWSQHGR